MDWTYVRASTPGGFEANHNQGIASTRLKRSVGRALSGSKKLNLFANETL
jgi:hypothetical protein